jgi:hypothetical protein
MTCGTYGFQFLLVLGIKNMALHILSKALALSYILSSTYGISKITGPE